MTDEEYLAWVEKRIRGSFSPHFGGSTFFNRELFDFVLAQAGRDITVLDRHMANFNRTQDEGRRAKLRVDNARVAIKLKIYTPTSARKVTITPGAVDVRAMSPDE